MAGDGAQGMAALLADRTVVQTAGNQHRSHQQKHEEAFGSDSEHCCSDQSTVHMGRIQFVFGSQTGSFIKEFPRHASHCVR